MDQFEAARLKHQKGRERKEAWLERREMREAAEPPKQKDVGKLLQPAPKTTFTVSVEGLHSLTFEVNYGGALIGGQLTEEGLRSLFKKQLSVMGKVNDVY